MFATLPTLRPIVAEERQVPVPSYRATNILPPS